MEYEKCKSKMSQIWGHVSASSSMAPALKQSMQMHNCALPVCFRSSGFFTFKKFHVPHWNDRPSLHFVAVYMEIYRLESVAGLQQTLQRHSVFLKVTRKYLL